LHHFGQNSDSRGRFSSAASSNEAIMPLFVTVRRVFLVLSSAELVAVRSRSRTFYASELWGDSFALLRFLALKVGAHGSHSAAAAGYASPAVRPVAGGAAAPAVAGRPRPPAGPGALRPASAAPEAPTALCCPHDHLGFAQRAVPTPGHMRPRLFLR